MTETTDYLKMVKRIIRAAAARVGQGDEIDLREFSDLKNYLDDMITEAIYLQITDGKSWSQIATGLGVSKQAAFKRYSCRVNTRTFKAITNAN